MANPFRAKSGEFDMDFTEKTFHIDLTFPNDGNFNTQFDAMGSASNNDHRELFHRDAAEQHPITAITNLEDELEVRPDEYLSNLDIHDILNH